MAQPKIIVNEVRGNASSGKFDERIGYIVKKQSNSTRYCIGQRISVAEVDELIRLNLFTVDIADKEFGELTTAK